VATSLDNIALALSDQGKLQDALEYLQSRARVIREQSQSGSFQLAATYCSLGLVFLLAQADLTGALAEYSKALPISEQLAPDSEQMQTLRSAILHVLTFLGVAVQQKGMKKGPPVGD
jgi:tetratricopeptide (TPR) repeat protein